MNKDDMIYEVNQEGVHVIIRALKIFITAVGQDKASVAVAQRLLDEVAKQRQNVVTERNESMVADEPVIEEN